MKGQKYIQRAIFAVLVLIFQIVLHSNSFAQIKAETKPELKVAGVELGNRESAREFLSKGFHPKIGEDKRAHYYFYNEWGTQVMRLTAPSVEDKYFITEIEVYRVSKKYRKRHFHLEETKYFQTESGIFIGFKQTAGFFLLAIENLGGINRFKPKNLIKLKGEPDERKKTDKKRETLTYEFSGIELSDKKTSANYRADYEFYKNKLRRFTLKITPEKIFAKEQ